MTRLLALLLIACLAGAAAHAQPTDPDFATPFALDWRQHADGSATRMITVTPNADGSPVRVDLDLPMAGHVAAKPVPAGETAPSLPILFDGAGIQSGTATARIGLPDGAYLELPLAADAAPVEIVLSVAPDHDFAEPDNDVLLAWPVDLNETGEIRLMPAGDLDHVRFSLPEARQVRVHVFDPPLEVATTFLDPETGDVTAEGPSALLAAGDHVIRFRAVNPQAARIEPITYRIIASRPDAVADGLVTLAIGRPALITPDSSGQARARLEVTESGLYSFVTSNAGSAPRFELHFDDGNVVPLTSPGFHLAPGPVEIVLRGIVTGDAPAFLTAYRSLAADPDEPNDLARWATAIDAGENQTILLEAASPVDWLTFTAPADGRLFFHARQEAIPCSPLRITLAPRESGEAGGPLQGAGIASDFSFTPFAVADGETVTFQLSCGGAALDTEIGLSVLFQSAEGGSAPDDSSIHIVGFELDAETSARFEALADHAGVNFLRADEAGELATRIEAIGRAEGRGGGGTALLSTLVVLLLFAGGGVWLWLRRRREKA